MEKKTNKYFYIVSIIVALLIIGIIIGTSFAFFTGGSSSTSGSATVITSGSLSLELNDGNVVGITDGMIPGDSVTKSFSVTNTGTQSLAYDIYLSEIYNNFADKSDLVYSINSTDGGYNTTSDKVVPSEVGAQSKIISSYVIDAGATHTYTLTIKFLSKNENQDDNKGKTFSAKLQINDYTSYKIAMLDTGENVNEKIKKLVNPNARRSDIDESITAIRRANQIDDSKEKVDISSELSDIQIYAWYDNGTVYYYSLADKIFMNEDSLYLFSNFWNVTEIELNTFDSSKVINMAAMFEDCRSLEVLDLSSFDTSNSIAMAYLFSNCIKLRAIYVSEKWTTENLDLEYGGQELFFDCINLIGGQGWSFRNSSYYGYEDLAAISSAFAHIDEGESNPGYLTNINDKNSKNNNGYNYWDYSYYSLVETPVYNSTSAPLVVYPNYNYIIRKNESSALIRTTYADGNPTKHGACVNTGEPDKLFCLDYGYWTQNGSNISSVEEALKSEMETALGTTLPSCDIGSDYVFCGYFGESCTAFSDNSVECQGYYNICSVDNEGNAQCYE